MEELLRYTCLILDHDDTAVDSTAGIHYPAHLRMMKKLRPGHKPVSLEQWYLKNFNPGIMEYLLHELGLDELELKEEYKIWHQHTSDQIPHFYPGFIEALKIYREQNGKISVVSHSEKEFIERDYTANNFMPDVIFGWNYDENKRKPHPWPVLETMKRTGIEASRILVVDDLKPGVLMAGEAGVHIAAAGWAHSIPDIESYMRKNCQVYFKTVAEFRVFILA